MTFIIRDKVTKRAVAELSDGHTQYINRDRYEAVTPGQHLRELNILGSLARQAAIALESLDRAMLEAMALEAVSADDVYQLRDTITETPDADLIRLIQEQKEND